MIIKLNTSVAGGSGEAHAGDFAEMPDDVARRYVERGMAEVYDPVKHGQPDHVVVFAVPARPEGSVLSRVAEKFTKGSLVPKRKP
jgi:hypothetical protein